MALNRRSGQRFQASIWPGFVDAMTALLLVLIFVLTIFMVVQSIQTETISGQETELDRLTLEIETLATALGAEQQRNFELEGDVDDLGAALSRAESNEAFQNRLIDTLTAEMEQRNAELGAARGQITAFEAQVAALLADREAARGQVADLQQNVTDLSEDVSDLTDRRDALETALAQARTEIDAGEEAARLAAARREALQAMVADLRNQQDAQTDQIGTLQGQLDDASQALTEAQAARLADAEAARLLRARLENADAELTAMSLALEEQRKQAEDTLTLLAAARSAQADLDERLMAALLEGDQSETALDAARAELETARARLEDEGATAQDLRERLADALAAREIAESDLAATMTDAERQARLLASAQTELSNLSESSADDKRRLAALNAQLAALRGQLGELQSLLDTADARDAASNVQIELMGARLNTALARVAQEERRRAELEEAERKRLEYEAQRLENYRSEFFGRLREILGEQEGVQIVGDRFVFSSEVLFASGAADLSLEGRAEVAKVAQTLQQVAASIPAGIDWVIRVDGHTDDVPVSGSGPFADNWELSQARALSVVRFMIDNYGFPANRLAATGFAEFQPVDPRSTAQARARNRRIELKLTER